MPTADLPNILPTILVRACGLVALLAALPTPGSAQTSADSAHADSTREQARLGAVVVTATPMPRPSAVTLSSGGLPTAVTVLDHAAIERTNLGRDVGTLLRRVPGIMSHTLGQGDVGNSIKMRGFATSTHGADVAVYVDGVPQNVPSAAIAHGMNDMSWLTPEMIERIEVIKGPFSALYGDQNRAGAVNIVTRSAAAGSSVAATLGSHGTQRGTLVLSAGRGRTSALLVADRLTDDGWRDNSDGTRGTVFLKGAAVRGRSLWSLRGTYHNADWNAPGFLNFNGLLGGPLRPTDRDTTSPPLWGNAERSAVVLTHAPAVGERGLHASAYAESYKRNRALGVNRTDVNVQHDDRRIFGARVLENLVFGERAALALGGELRGDRGDAIHRRWPGGVPGPNYTFDQDLDLLTYGVFAQGQYKPVARVKLLAGVRLDAFDHDVRNRKLPAASVKYRHSVATPRGGIVWTPLEQVDLFANVGQGFRSPNQSEISPSGSVGPLGAAGGAPQPDLEPPTVTSYDAGATAAFGYRLRLTAARYHTLNRNEITMTAPGVFASVGNTTRDGWELESRLSATDALGLYASYGRILRARINTAAPGTADRLTVPAHTVKGGVAYTVPVGAGRLLLDLDASRISGVPYFAGTPIALAFTRAYARYDLRVTHERGRVQLTAFATSQPIAFGSEVATSSAAGALIDPRPRTEGGALVRIRFRDR
jgi:outer membrane receptor protein involved in Fe transport